jgi:type VI secretion system protein ImpH
MASAQRKSGPPLKSRLFDEFYRFSFYKAVDLLEAFSPERKGLGETLDPEQEAVRFAVKPGFSFPPSDISNLKQSESGKAAKMEVRFLGLIGPSGVLPHWYNELAVERVRSRDSTLVDFLDIFHHRLITLFYLAWKRTNLPANYLSGGKDRLSWYLLSLIGLGTEGMRGRIGLPEESLIFCSGLLGRQVPSVAAVQAAVRYMSGADVELQQFIERIVPLDPEDCTQLGAANALLGESAVCGSFAYECQSKFRVELGPVGYEQFVRFLPSGDLLKPIFALIRYMVGIEYEFEIGVTLRAREVPGCRLGDTSPGAPRLGWSTWTLGPGVTPTNDAHVTFQETDLKN